MQTAPSATPPAAPPTSPQIDGRLRPERPKLADGVKLAGQMQESAFENPPWLLERDGAGYVQVTELLYHIAEAANGQRTVQEMAQQVSTPDKAVSPETVQSLIARLLIPRGLVQAADGRVAAAPGGGGSPLALNMRMKMIQPEAIMPITRVLKTLFWPPILIAVLLVAATTEAWIYFVHGIGSGIHDALYAPGLMLVVLLVIVVSAAFHELGHAAALHYAGGRIKGMGAGMYMVYPAFFTDVSDNYRLPRWARVRTDLGGFYFNLIFALGIMGLFVLTGQEFLLLMVLMINLEIIHQLLPFLRLDGYWALADVTGVPDFFSQMTAFVRSVVPIKAWHGRKLPALKWWGKVVFALYILTAIPLLGLLLLVMIRSVPRVLATAWDSLGQQAQGIISAQSQGDLLGILGSAGQGLLLLVPTLGLAYTLFSLGKRLIVGLWHWGDASAARRVVGTLVTIASLGALAFMWLPQIPLPGATGNAATGGGLFSQVSWQPIGPNERGTLQDALAGLVATREPVAGSTPTPESTAAPAAATPRATVGAFTDAQTRGTAEPAAVSTVLPTVFPTAVPTPLPLATPVPQPPVPQPPAPAVRPPAPTAAAAPTLTAPQATAAARAAAQTAVAATRTPTTGP